MDTLTVFIDKWGNWDLENWTELQKVPGLGMWMGAGKGGRVETVSLVTELCPAPPCCLLEHSSAVDGWDPRLSGITHMQYCSVTKNLSCWPQSGIREEGLASGFCVFHSAPGTGDHQAVGGDWPGPGNCLCTGQQAWTHSHSPSQMRSLFLLSPRNTSTALERPDFSKSFWCPQDQSSIHCKKLSKVFTQSRKKYGASSSSGEIQGYPWLQQVTGARVGVILSSWRAEGSSGLCTCELTLSTFHTLPTICAAWAGQSPWGLRRRLSQGLYSCPERGLPTWRWKVSKKRRIRETSRCVYSAF